MPLKKFEEQQNTHACKRGMFVCLCMYVCVCVCVCVLGKTAFGSGSFPEIFL